LNLPLRVRLVAADPKVKKLRGKVAVMRGPIVYCMELPTRDGGEEAFHRGVLLPENVEFTPEHRADFLGGVTVLNGHALTLIPYYAWANRGLSFMDVWLPLAR